MTSKLSSHPNDSISTGEEKLQMELLTTVEASKMVPQFNLEKCVNEYATRPSDEHWRKADRWEVAEYRRTHWSRSAMQLRTIISKGEVTAYKKRGRWYIVPRSLKRWIQRHEVREVFEREIIEGFEQAYYELSYSDVNIYIELGGDEELYKHFTNEMYGPWLPDSVLTKSKNGGMVLLIPPEMIDRVVRNLRAAIRLDIIDTGTAEWYMESLRYSVDTLDFSSVDSLELEIRRAARQNRGA